MTERIVIDGEVFLSLTTVATCFHVEVSFVEEVYGMGLLGPGRQKSGIVLVEACQLDRFARIVQLHRYHGVELDAVAVLLRLT